MGWNGMFVVFIVSWVCEESFCGTRYIVQYRCKVVIYTIDINISTNIAAGEFFFVSDARTSLL